MLSLFLFVIKNKNKFKLNSGVYNVSTRQKYNFNQPSLYLSLYKKGVLNWYESIQQFPTKYKKFRWYL
jgi:hypothetical protein